MVMGGAGATKCASEKKNLCQVSLADFRVAYDDWKSNVDHRKQSPFFSAACETLPGLWHDSTRPFRAAPPRAPSTSNSMIPSIQIYLDVADVKGTATNLGACVFQMLFAVPDVPILAFDPDPQNVFRLTSTLGRLNSTLRNRVVVFPLGLRRKNKAKTISVSRCAVHHPVVAPHDGCDHEGNLSFPVE